MCPCGGVRAWIGFEEGVDGRCVRRVENDAVDVEQSRVGLSIFGPVRFWTKIYNQTDFILFLVLEPNRTENRFKPINFGSVRFGFFPFQTGSNLNFYTCFHFPKNQLQFSFCSPCPEVEPSKKIHKTKGFACKKTKRKSKVIEM